VKVFGIVALVVVVLVVVLVLVGGGHGPGRHMPSSDAGGGTPPAGVEGRTFVAVADDGTRSGAGLGHRPPDGGHR
jgi:hypothetical protein